MIFGVDEPQCPSRYYEFESKKIEEETHTPFTPKHFKDDKKVIALIKELELREHKPLKRLANCRCDSKPFKVGDKVWASWKKLDKFKAEIDKVEYENLPNIA